MKGTTKFLNVIGFHVPEFLHSVTTIFKGDFTCKHAADYMAHDAAHRPPRPGQSLLSSLRLHMCPVKARQWVGASSLKFNQLCASSCIPLIKPPK